MATAAPWRDRLERATGRSQLALLRRGLAAAAGLAPSAVRGAGPDIAILARGGRGAPLVCLLGFGGYN